jgi:hypothetical protein
MLGSKFDQEQVIGFQMSVPSGLHSLKRWKFVWWVCGLPKKERRMSASSTEKLPPPHSRFATTRFILLMPSKGTRKTKFAKRGFWSHIRNEFEVSPQIFCLESLKRWLSGQHFRSKHHDVAVRDQHENGVESSRAARRDR